MNRIVPDKQSAAVCGLLCKSCGIYIATEQNNREALSRIAVRLNIPFDKVRCSGCRGDLLSAHCESCYFRECSVKRGIEFCSQCSDFPCEKLSDFQTKMPHRVDLFRSLERIKEAGWERWYVEAVEKHTCTKCNCLNGWYDLSCKGCGNTPSTPFASENFDKLSTFGK